MNQDLIDRLKLEVQMHAQEARTANATIAEIYQLCSGGKGEPGNWHGAEPVRAVIAERDAYAATLRQQAERSGVAVYAVAHDGVSDSGHQLYTIHDAPVPNADNWKLYAQADRAAGPDERKDVTCGIGVVRFQAQFDDGDDE